MVAGSQNVGAAFQKLAGNSRRDAEAVGGVFNIDDNYVGLVFSRISGRLFKTASLPARPTTSPK